MRTRAVLGCATLPTPVPLHRDPHFFAQNLGNELCKWLILNRSCERWFTISSPAPLLLVPAAGWLDVSSQFRLPAPPQSPRRTRLSPWRDLLYCTAAVLQICARSPQRAVERVRRASPHGIPCPNSGAVAVFLSQRFIRSRSLPLMT